MFQIIKVPSSIGAPILNTGMEKGPGVLASFLLSKYYSNFDRKVISVNIPVPNPLHQGEDYKIGRYLPEIRAISKDLMRKVSFIIKKGKKPLVLMGDDSSAIGAVYGVLQEKTDVGIIWFDAHGDVNTPKTSPSGCFYGMGLAHIIGYGHQKILKLNFDSKFIRPANVVMVGQRDLDLAEIKFIERNGILKYSAQDLEDEFEEKISILIKRFKHDGIKNVFLHYDLDVLDSLENPAVFTPIPNGLSSTLLYQITDCVKNNFEIVGVSIANHVPYKDKNCQCKSIINSLVRKILDE